jgi:cell division septum initiation protein DivIVA
LPEKLIQQVLEIEKQAQTIHDAAVSQAEQLPVHTEKEAQDLIEKARAEAQTEARQLVADAQAQDECARILAKADEDSARLEALAMNHFDRAVSYVLDRVIGKD